MDRVAAHRSVRRGTSIRLTGTGLAGLIGVCCLLPGIAILTLGDIGVQPLLLVLAVYIGIVLVLGIRLPAQPLQWLALVLAGYALTTLFSVWPATSLKVSALQGCYIVFGGIGFAAIFAVPSHRQAFMRGYVLSAIVSSLVAVFQAVYSSVSGHAFALANNSNFSIVEGYGRGAAFTPEPSVLAGLLIPALLACWFDREGDGGLLRPWQRSIAALVMLILGLLATKSTSLFYLPILFVLVSAVESRSVRAFVKGVMVMLVAAVAAAGLFLHFYSSRLTDADASSSQAWRLTKVKAGIDIFAAYPMTGAGLGLVSDPTFFAPYMNIPPELSWSSEPRKGIDSTAIRILAESGSLGFLLFYYPVILYFRRAQLIFRSPAFKAIGALSFGLLFAQTFLSGYRDQIVFLAPVAAFAIAGNALATVTRGRRVARESAEHPVTAFSQGSA